MSLFDHIDQTPRWGDLDPSARKSKGNAESAAAWAGKTNTATDRATILDLIRAAGQRGMTLDEVCEKLGRNPNELSGRITELAGRGFIVRKRLAGKPVTRPTRTGANAAVWVSVTDGVTR